MPTINSFLINWNEWRESQMVYLLYYSNQHPRQATKQAFRKMSWIEHVNNGDERERGGEWIISICIFSILPIEVSSGVEADWQQ